MGYFGDIKDPPEGWIWVVPHSYPNHKPWRIQWSALVGRTNPEMSAVLAMVDWDNESPIGSPKRRETPNPAYSDDTVFTNTVQVLEFCIGETPTTRRNGVKKWGRSESFIDDQGRECWNVSDSNEYWEAEECGVPVWGY